MPQLLAGAGVSTTMIGSIRQDGSTACMTVKGAVNSEIFRTYVREVLLPEMRSGDVLIMDNLGAHKDRQALALLKGCGGDGEVPASLFA